MSGDVMPRPRVVSPRAHPILPWLLLALTVVLGGTAVVFLMVNQGGPAREPIPSVYGDLLYLFSAIVGGAVGALIAARRPRNPIGWILLGTAFFQVAEDVFVGYSTFGLITQLGALPGAIIFAWLAQWMWTLPFAALLLFILLYPTGHLLSPRWRVVAWAGMVGVAVLLLATAFASELILVYRNPPLTFPNPVGLIDTKNIVQPILLPFAYTFVLATLFASLASLVIRFRRAQGDERQQLKWFTYAVALALVTEVVASVVLGEWAQAVQNLAFLMLPLSVGVAILRYRLYDIDLLINRTLVYLPLTAILAGIYAASIALSQKLFVAVTGRTSDAATVLTTLVVVAAFTPVKDGLQALVDKRFKEPPDPAKKLKAFNQELQSVVRVFNVEQTARRFLDEATAAFDAAGGVVSLETEGQPPRVYTVGAWNGQAKVSLSLADNGKRFGVVQLAARRNGADYTAEDAKTLQENAQLVATAIALAERTNGTAGGSSASP